jgi:predicted GIY-YIG superfamily endonuclease
VHSFLFVHHRSGDGWEYCEYVGVTQNLEEALNSHLAKQGKDAVAYVRALSFPYPQRTAMEDVALQWRRLIHEAGGSLQQWAGENFFDDLDDDDDDEDEEEEWLMETAPPAVSSETEQAIVSPFSSGAEASVVVAGYKLALTKENVDKVLEEVRPYLISDGGNVAVERVDEVTKNVYLILEGACGKSVSLDSVYCSWAFFQCF